MRCTKNWIKAVPVACAVVMLMSAVSPGQPSSGVKADTAKAITPAKQLKPQTTCPVSGDPIDKKHYVDRNGKRIYLCCQNCIAPVRKDPDKYIKKLEGMGQGVETLGPDTKKDSAAASADSSANKMNMKNMVATADSGTGKMQMKNMKTAGDTALPAADAGYWTCPMHPAVHKAGPGTCPICSMNLVQKKAAPPAKK